MTGSVERFRAFALIVLLLAAACTPRAGEPSVTMPATASALAVAPDFSGTIWAATGKRVYRSHDGGHSWRVVPGRGGATGVAFLSTRDGTAEIYVMQANGSNPVRLTTNALAEGGKMGWSPDGSKIAFYAAGDANTGIYVMDADGGNVTRLTQGASNDRSPTWSPDGRRIAFTSDRDGDDEVYVMNADGTGAVRLTTSAAPDVLDAWRR